MALPEEPLSIVEQWKKKGYEMSSKSNDSIATLITHGIDSMAQVLNNKSDISRIHRVLTYLEYERSVSLQLDEFKNDVVRTLVYGLIESLHFTLTELTNERNQVNECGEMLTKTEEEFSQLSPKYAPSSNNYDVRTLNDPHTIPNLFELLEEEPFDDSVIKDEEYWGDEVDMGDEEVFKDDVDFAEEGDDVSSIVDTDLTNISWGDAHRLAKFADCNSLDNSHEDSEPPVKKSKVDLSKMKNNKTSDAIEKKSGSARTKRRSSDINCTECEFQTTSGDAIIHHLRNKHNTTLAMAGLALRCDCGLVTRSNGHIYKCDVANFTIVRTRDGPIQTFNDEKKTPQCILCETYPTTAKGYILHLYIHHKTSLSANGIYLECSCGVKYRNNHPDSKHTNQCIRREYTLQKKCDK